jgi:hypothetical protein
MVACERGYLCDVCGGDVGEITESDLYLRYVLGEVDPETLHMQPERHIRCNPTLAQFIVAEGFAPMEAPGFFAKSQLDRAFVAAEEARVTRGYLRLCALPTLGLPLTEYPLPEVRARWEGPPAGTAADAEEVVEPEAQEAASRAARGQADSPPAPGTTG